MAARGRRREPSPTSRGGIARLLAGLRAIDAKERAAAVRALADFVAMDASEMAVDEAQAFLAELYRAIDDLVRSSVSHERAGGVDAIDSLLEVDFEEAEEAGAKLARYAAYLRTALEHPANDDGDVRAAASVLGHLARVGGELATEAIDAEIRRALELLNADGGSARERRPPPRAREGTEMGAERRLLVASCVLAELATDAPALMYAHLPALFERIWTPLTDYALNTREAAAATLRASLRLVAARPTHFSRDTYVELLKRANAALGGASEPAWVQHGAMLALLACARTRPPLFPHAHPPPRLTAARACAGSSPRRAPARATPSSRWPRHS